MDINEIRLENINKIVDARCRGVKAEFARKLGKEPAGIARWWSKSEKHRRNIGSRSARFIEEVFKLPSGWLDSTHQDYALETDPQKRITKQLQSGDTYKIQLLDRCTIDNNLALTLLNISLKGELMLLSTDRNAYALEFLGHHSEKILSSGWGIVIEPDTPLTEDEYALIKLKSGEMLLRVITYADDDMIVAMNPVNKQQNTIPTAQIERAEYCYIGIPPSKIIVNNTM